MPFKHKKTSTLPDLPDTTQIRPSDWNDDHMLSGGADGDLLVYDDAATDKMGFTKTPQISALYYNQPSPTTPQNGYEWTVRTGTSPNRTITHYVRDGGVTYVAWEITV